VEDAQMRQTAIIADELGEVNREKHTLTRPFLACAKSILNRQLIREFDEK
jgi:hypothetical protein